MELAFDCSGFTRPKEEKQGERVREKAVCCALLLLLFLDCKAFFFHVLRDSRDAEGEIVLFCACVYVILSSITESWKVLHYFAETNAICVHILIKYLHETSARLYYHLFLRFALREQSATGIIRSNFQ